MKRYELIYDDDGIPIEMKESENGYEAAELYVAFWRAYNESQRKFGGMFLDIEYRRQQLYKLGNVVSNETMGKFNYNKFKELYYDSQKIREHL